MTRRKPRARKISLETLEARATPSWAISVVGNAVKFSHNSDGDALALSTDTSGYLQHDLTDPGYASSIDLNPVTTGVQSKRVAQISQLTIDGTGTSIFLSLDNIKHTARIKVDTLSIDLSDSPNADARFAPTAAGGNIIVTGAAAPASFTYILQRPISGINFVAGAGRNRLDFSKFTGGASLIGGADNDTLLSGVGSDQLEGGAGDDSLFSGAGSDAVLAGAGADRYNGGADDDYLQDDVTANATLTNLDLVVDGLAHPNHQFERFQLDGSDAANSIDASGLTFASVNISGNGGNDTLIGGFQADYILGGDGDDVLTGNDERDGLYGEDGNDTLYGNAGDDLLYAHDGNDVVYGGEGGDTIDVAEGDDLYYGEGGSDSVVDVFDDGHSYDVTVTGTNITISKDGGSPLGFLHEAEYFSLTGGNGNDRIDITALPNQFTLSGPDIHGGAGNDTLIGSAFLDHLFGDAGDDSLVGGNGNNHMEGGDDNDTIIGGNGREFAFGGKGNDFLDGGSENDALMGDGSSSDFGTYRPYGEGDGNDTIVGGEGDDNLHGHGGADSVDAGNGYDRLYDSLGDGDDTADLTDTTITLNGIAFDPFAEQIFLYGGPGNDTMDASAINLRIVTLDGNSGNDSLVGSIFRDYMAGGAGDDTLRGGDGFDYLTDVSVDSFPESSGGKDLFDGGNHDDELRPGGDDDTLLGGDGNDRLDAGHGDDTYDAGTGTDDWINDVLFTREADGNQAIITDADITLTRNDGTTESFAHNAERFEVGGSAFDDVMDASGFSHGVVFYGGDGDDVLIAGNGPHATGAFRDNFLWGQGGGDTLVSGTTNDFMTGDDYGSEGPDGDDSIFGGGGNDFLNGEGGNDTLVGGEGDDELFAGAGQNALYGDAGNDTLSNGPDASVIFGGDDSNYLYLFGTEGDDTINVAEGSVTINGNLTTFANLESVTIDAGAGVDIGHQSGALSIPLLVYYLEPTISFTPAMNHATRTLSGTGDFIDIGIGQSWTATVNYGDGTGDLPLVLTPDFNSVENRHTYVLDHTYAASGNYTVTVTIADNQGISTREQVVTVAPTVTQARVYFGNGTTTVVPLSSLAGRTLPWLYVRKIDVTFSDDVVVQSNDLALTGTGAPRVRTFQYNAATHVATWTFRSRLPKGRFVLTLDGDSATAIADANGVKLAGGAAVGSDFVSNLGVLFGDVDGDGTVDQDDVTQVTAGVTGAYNGFNDVNGDGRVTNVDVNIVKARLGSTLP